MTPSEIYNHLKDGRTVYWSNEAYEVRADSDGDLIVWCNLNSYCGGRIHQSDLAKCFVKS